MVKAERQGFKVYMALPLIVSANGHQHILRTPSELPDFCAGLDLDLVELPDWYADFVLPPHDRSPTRSPFSTPEKRLPKKMKHGKAGGSETGTPNLTLVPERDKAEG